MSTSSFPDSFDDSVPPPTESSHPFDNDDDSTFVGSEYTPPPYNNNNFDHSESVHNSFDDSAAFSNSASDGAVFGSNGGPLDNGVFSESDGPILPPPDDMQEDGFALRQWRKENALVLELKEKREKELLNQTIEEATEYKVNFHEKRKTTCEKNITDNREKEKLFLANHETFHKEADKNYWKAIAELIPNEVPVIKKRGKKEDEKKPSVVVIQGPKPGKPTDLVRMRQILVKLKHSTPDHLKLAPPAAAADKDTKSGTSTSAAAPSTVEKVATSAEAVAVA